MALRHNLPAELTSFVGRHTELATAHELLARTRLLTLSGTGGAGKTRLALRIAADLVDTSKDGVWFVDLAPLADGAHVASAIAITLAIREQPPLETLDSIIAAARERELVLVLDNCEHVVDAAATTTRALLRACPRLRVLATSREALGVEGEMVFPVPSLSLPDAHQLGSPEALLEAESARLFFERARAVRPDQSIAQRDVAAVAEICHRLDGIPLALELAAARTRVLGYGQLAGRLDDRFRLLVAGHRTAPQRHQTLRATLDWSHDLLTDPERVLLRRVSVFAGGFTLDAAEVVCDVDNTLDVLGSLIDKSLVLADGGRYRLLHTVREYGLEKLADCAEHGQLHDRHADWCVALAEQAEADFRGARQTDRLDQLDQEHDNIRAALNWAAERPAGAAVMLRVAAALWWFWRERGHASEGRRWLDRASTLEAAVPPALRARALDAAGALAHSQGAYAAARRLEEQALALWREQGDLRGMSVSLNTLGIVAKAEGDHARAAELLEEMLGLAREAGDDSRAATALNNLAALAIDQGDFSRARPFLEESLAIKRRLGDRVGIVAALHNLGESAFHLEAYRDAAALLRDAVALSRELGATHRLAQSLHSLGLTSLRLRDEPHAMLSLKEGLTLFLEMNDEWGVMLCLEGLGQAPSVQTRSGTALRLLAAAAQWREANGSPVPPNERAEYDRALQTARARLEPSIAAQEWSAGWRLTLDDAAQVALSVPVPVPTEAPAVGLLTAREHEVGNLVARGLTNRQIADALHISKPTADRHVSNILGKLELSTRAQLAAWVVSQRHRS